MDTLYYIKGFLFICFIYFISKTLTQKRTDKAYDYLLVSLVFLCLSLWIQTVN